MDIKSAAIKIAQKYIDQKDDMNEAISKYASDNSLNLDQTQRLVEECNKFAYLSLFEKTGEQIFDVASLDKVRSHFIDPINKKESYEKTAAINNDLNAYGLNLDINKSESIEKTASKSIDYNEYDLENSFKDALMHCDNELGKNLTKMASLRKVAVRNRPSLEKVATYTELSFELSKQKTETFDKLASDLNESIKEYEKYSKMKNVLIEKKASILSSVVEGTGSLIGKGVGLVAKNPIKSLNTAFVGGTAISAFKKPMQNSQNLIGNVMIPKTAEEKTASEITPSVLNFITSHILPAAGVGLGLAAIGGAGSALGNMISSAMDKRKLNTSFEDLLAKNPDLQKDPVQSRAYFDVIARHAPSLALDPLVAPQLIQQFDSFGGVDVQTVKNLREIESEGIRRSTGGGLFESSLGVASNLSNIGKSIDEHSGHRAELSSLKSKLKQIERK